MINIICIIIGIIAIIGIVVRILSSPFLICVTAIVLLAGFFGVNTMNPFALGITLVGLMILGGSLGGKGD